MQSDPAPVHPNFLPNLKSDHPNLRPLLLAISHRCRIFPRNRSINVDYNRGGKVQQDRSLLLLAVVENVNIYQHTKSNEIPHPQRRPPHTPIKEHIYSCWPEKWNMTRGKLESLIRRPFCMFKQPNRKPCPVYDYYCNRNIKESGGGIVNTVQKYPFSNFKNCPN